MNNQVINNHMIIQKLTAFKKMHEENKLKDLIEKTIQKEIRESEEMESKSHYISPSVLRLGAIIKQNIIIKIEPINYSPI